MDKSELIQLIEGPVLKAYSHHINKNGKRTREEQIENNSKNNETISTFSTTTTNTLNSSNSKDYPVPLSEAQRDRRTVFVQQLSVRCNDRDLFEFFTSNSCPVRHARIVLDKFTRKSKGVAYVEFFEEETVRAALKLSGKKILGVPVIVELTETEKNRIAQEAASLNAAMIKTSGSSTATALASTSAISSTPSDDLVRLYIGSLHPSLTELELEQLFEPFGELESVELLKDDRSGESKGVAFVQYKKVGGAKMALEALNGFELAGRAIRVGPVRIDKSKQQPQQGKPSKPLPSQQQQQQAREVDEEENITLNAQKRAELMQKLQRK
jgi:RNA-binding protein 23/39